MMKISEIFLSIQGEGIDQGEPCIFVRAFSCNNHCKYCDTQYAIQGNNYREINIDEIMEKIKQFDYKNLCFTGGEPLLQADAFEFCKRLADNGYTVWIETNGTLPIDDYVKLDNIKIVMDIKCPSSGMQENTKWENLKLLRSCDQIKFVVATNEDYGFTRDNIQKIQDFCQAKFLISPTFAQDEFKSELIPAQIIQKVLDDKLPARISLQLHKIIWDPKDKEGIQI